MKVKIIVHTHGAVNKPGLTQLRNGLVYGTKRQEGSVVGAARKHNTVAKPLRAPFGLPGLFGHINSTNSILHFLSLLTRMGTHSALLVEYNTFFHVNSVFRERFA